MMNESQNSKRFRLRIKFSLRFVLLLMFISAFPLAWLAGMLAEYRRQTSFVDSVKVASGKSKLNDDYLDFFYDYQYANNEIRSGGFKKDREPPGPKWLRSIFGELLFARVIRVVVCGDAFIEGVEFENATSIRSVDIRFCENMDSLDSIESLKNLEYLAVKGCPKLQNIGAVGSMSRLRSLDLFHHSEESCLVTDWKPISQLFALESLCMGWCPWEDFSIINKLTGLRGIVFDNCPNLNSLSGLANLKQLKTLVLYDAVELRDFSELNLLTKLEELELTGVPDLQDLIFVNKLDNLQRIRLQSTKLQTLAGIESVKCLNCLTIEQSPIKDLAGIENALALTELQCHQCKNLTDLTALSGHLKLELIWLAGCPNMESLQLPERAPNLDRIFLDSMGIRSLDGFVRFTQLTRVDLNGCKRLKNIDALFSLPNLTEFDWHDCSGLDKKDVQRLKQKFPKALIRPGPDT